MAVNESHTAGRDIGTIARATSYAYGRVNGKPEGRETVADVGEPNPELSVVACPYFT